MAISAFSLPSTDHEKRSVPAVLACVDPGPGAPAVVAAAARIAKRFKRPLIIFYAMAFDRGQSRLPDPLDFVSHRKFVRQVLAREVDLRTSGAEFVPLSAESKASLVYRTHMNRDGSPSEAVAAGYRWAPGTELTSLLIPAASTQLFKRAGGA